MCQDEKARIGSITALKREQLLGEFSVITEYCKEIEEVTRPRYNATNVPENISEIQADKLVRDLVSHLNLIQR